MSPNEFRFLRIVVLLVTFGLVRLSGTFVNRETGETVRIGYKENKE